MLNGVTTLLGFVIVLALLFGMLSGVTGEQNKGNQIIMNCVTVLILYLLVIELFNIGLPHGGIFETGIPLINSVEEAGSLKVLILDHTAMFALDFVELVTLTVIINWISGIVQFEGAGFVGKITSRIAIVLMGVIAYGFFMEFARDNVILKWCVYCVECILTGGSILYTPAMLIAAITGLSKDHMAVTYFLTEFKKSSFAKAITNGISSSILFLGYALILESQYGSICNVLGGAVALMEYFGVIIIMIMGIYFMLRSLK